MQNMQVKDLGTIVKTMIDRSIEKYLSGNITRTSDTLENISFDVSAVYNKMAIDIEVIEGQVSRVELTNFNDIAPN